MEKIYPGQEVVSLFNFGLKPRQFNEANPGALTKIILVVSAFFVVAAMSLAFNFLSQNLEARTKRAAAAGTEKAAWRPSQAISQQFRSGYFGR